MVVIVPWRLLSASVILVLFTYIQGCPSVCQCTTRNGQNIVDCSSQTLSSLPANLPINTTDLDFSDNFIAELKNLLPGESTENISVLSHLENLRSLSLSKNLIESIPDSVFLNLSMLNHLDLSDNNIQYVSGKTFEGLQNLDYLDLHGNKNLKIGNDTFQSLLLLTELDLSKTELSADNLWIPSTVEILQLRKNKWDFYRSSILNNLKNLVHLDLSANNLTLQDGDTLPLLVSLKTLNIRQNNIQKLSQNYFHAMPNLHKLILDNNPISEITSPVFKHLSHLQYLSISYMPNMFYLYKDTFSELRSLSTLQMANNPKLEYIHITTFFNLVSAKLINISYNNLSALHPVMFSMMENVTIDIQGNHFPCDCSVQWIIKQNNMSNIRVINATGIGCFDSNTNFLISSLVELQCGNVVVFENSTKFQARIGSSVILHCEWRGNPDALITWITPRGKKLVYYANHPEIWKSHPTVDVVMDNSDFHMVHPWHNSRSYQTDLEQYTDRLIVLSNGDLFIDYMLRSDTGVYQCIVENSRNKAFVDITLNIDQSILTEVKLWSFLIGLICAGSFFTLNLIYVLISALVRRCINQRRREAILRLVESIDQYKSAQLARLKDNYYTQINRIRDGYHNQLERIRENYTLQATRFKEGASQRREWASHKVDTIRENYNSQVARLKDNSAQKLEQVRETYNNQLLRVRDYGSAQMTRIHKKYKLKQRHVMKLLETMNFDNCRQIIDSECVRAESMIFETDHPDLNIPSPTHSDSEYQTASSNSDTPISSQHDLCQTEEVCLLHSNHVMQSDSSHLKGDYSIQITDNSSQLGEDSSKAMCEDIIDCDEIDQILVQIQLIDETDNESEKNKNSPNIETCV